MESGLKGQRGDVYMSPEGTEEQQRAEAWPLETREAAVMESLQEGTWAAGGCAVGCGYQHEPTFWRVLSPSAELLGPGWEEDTGPGESATRGTHQHHRHGLEGNTGIYPVAVISGRFR